MKKIINNIKKKKGLILIGFVNLLLLVGLFITKSYLIFGALIALFDTSIFVGGIVTKKRKKKKKTTKSKTGKGKKKKSKKKIFKIFLIGALILFIISLISLIGFIFYVIKNSPEFSPDNLYQKEATIIYDKDGELITKVGAQIREIITYDEMPQVLVDAIIATEDSRFFTHNGFDLPRFMKASLGQLQGNRSAGGGSTLTMQISKNAYTSSTSRGFEGIVRKFTDIYMSIFKIEKSYTKFEIIEFYANSNFLGSNAYGVEQASQVYYGKSAKDMNLAEAAVIAGLFNAPSYLDPNRNPEGANERKNTVLYLMNRHGYITKEEMDIAIDIHVSDLLKEPDEVEGDYQAFINTVIEEVETRTGDNPYVVPMEIYTTMDRSQQDHIDGIFNGDNYNWENDFVNAGVAVIDVNDGSISAIGAGRDHNGQKLFNFATMIDRQIGSTAKPLYNYGPGIEFNNWSTYHPFTDEPHSYSDGRDFKNWDGKYKGFYTLRDALKESRNIPAVKAFQSVKNSNINKFATSLGLSPELENGFVHEAHALGGYNGESPLSMATAYSSFANGGFYTEPYSYTKILYKESGDVVENKLAKERVMSSETAYMVMDLLVDSAKYGLGSTHNVNGVTYGAKTGTTNFAPETLEAFDLGSNAINDLWVSSTSAKYAVGLWYGYDQIYSDYYTRFGSTQHRRLFQSVAKGIFTENEGFKKPSGVVEVSVEIGTYPGKRPSEFTPKDKITVELFKSGTEPTDVSKRYSKLTSPTNLEVYQADDNIELSWDGIQTPDYHDIAFINRHFASLYSDTEFMQEQIAAHLKYNETVMGEFGYEVFKEKDGELISLGFTKETEYTYTPDKENEITFVVKSTYSIFKDNASEPLVKEFIVIPVIDSEVNGNSTISVKVGDTFTPKSKPVVVTSNEVDVTNLATVTMSIKDSDNNPVTVIDTNSSGVYYITYTVNYSSYSNTHTVTVIVS